jgi:hypothetical protein
MNYLRVAGSARFTSLLADLENAGFSTGGLPCQPRRFENADGPEGRHREGLDF